MADPVVIECAGSCSVTVVHELALPPLQLDAADAAQLAGAVLLVWATGYAFRVLIRTLNVDHKEDSSTAD